MTGSTSGAAPIAYDPNHFLDVIKERLQLRCDKALGKQLNLTLKAIENIRLRKLPIGASMLILAAEKCQVEIGELRRLMGDRRSRIRVTVPNQYITFCAGNFRT